jgi:NADH:ubiquinone oxidoreductase subunit 2 (subunit N)
LEAYLNYHLAVVGNFVLTSSQNLVKIFIVINLINNSESSVLEQAFLCTKI